MTQNFIFSSCFSWWTVDSSLVHVGWSSMVCRMGRATRNPS